MAAPADGDKDSKNVADLFYAARVDDIGTNIEPKAGANVVIFIDEVLLSNAPFSAIISSTARYNELTARLRAFKAVTGYWSFLSDISLKANGGIDKKMPDTVRQIFFDCLREVRTMMAMLEAAVSRGPAINPDGYFRACAASPNTIRLNVGGLNTYLSHGELTAVSMQALAMSTIAATTPEVNNNNYAPSTEPSTGNNAGDTLPGKRGPEGRNDNGRPSPQQRQQVTCNYCGKLAHSAADCRQRQRDERQAHYNNNGHNNNNNYRHQGNGNQGYNGNQGNNGGQYGQYNYGQNNHGPQNAPPPSLNLDPAILRAALEKYLKDLK